MNRRFALVFFVLWLMMLGMGFLAKGTFVGAMAHAMCFMLPMILLLAHFEPQIHKWLRDGDKK